MYYVKHVQLFFGEFSCKFSTIECEFIFNRGISKALQCITKYNTVYSIAWIRIEKGLVIVYFVL